MLIVKVEQYEDLSESEKICVSDNGSGKEYATYIRIIHNGLTMSLESDAMEREDATFWRDLSWVATMLQKVYEIGLAEGGEEESCQKEL